MTMAVLNDLPNELLVKIIKDFDLQALCQCAGVSRRFAKLARHLIVKDVVLTNRTHETHRERSRLFMRSMQEQPVLQAYIRTFRAREKSPFTPILIPKNPDPSRFYSPFEPSSWFIQDDLGPFPDWVNWLLSTRSMVFLDTLQLAGARINMESVIELMFIGQLRVLELEYDYFGTHFLFQKTPRHSTRTSPLLSLDLGLMPLFGNMLELIVAWPRALKQLRCSLVCIRRPADKLPAEKEPENEEPEIEEAENEESGNEEPENEEPENEEPENEEPETEESEYEEPENELFGMEEPGSRRPPIPKRYLISPALVVSSLESTKSSLVKLELLEFMGDWDGHDGSRLDLSEFSSLQVAKVPAICFSKMEFEYLAWADGPMEQDNTPIAVGVYKLLPRSLKHLTVTRDTLTLLLLCFSSSLEVLLIEAPTRSFTTSAKACSHAAETGSSNWLSSSWNIFRI